MSISDCELFEAQWLVLPESFLNRALYFEQVIHIFKMIFKNDCECFLKEIPNFSYGLYSSVSTPCYNYPAVIIMLSKS